MKHNAIGTFTLAAVFRLLVALQIIALPSFAIAQNTPAKSELQFEFSKVGEVSEINEKSFENQDSVLAGFQSTEIVLKWVSENRYVHSTPGHEIICREFPSGTLIWKLTPKAEAVEHISLVDGLLGVLTDDFAEIFDVKDGKLLNKISTRDMYRLANDRLPNLVFPLSKEQLLFLTDSDRFEQNGFVLDCSKRKLVRSFSSDANSPSIAFPCAISGSKYILSMGPDFVSIRDTEKDVDLFASASVKEREKEFQLLIGPELTLRAMPFFCPEKKKLIYTTEIFPGCWAAGPETIGGRISILDCNSKKESVIRYGEKQVRIDVNFSKEQIVMTGSLKELRLINFQGKLLAYSDSLLNRPQSHLSLSPRRPNVGGG